MEVYRIDCPICDAKTKQQLELPDTSVVYNIEGFDSGTDSIIPWRTPDPTAATGANMLMDREIFNVDELSCDNHHDIIVRHCHYSEVDDEKNMLYGPSERPTVRCPKCQYSLGDHAEYIYRIGKGKDMQYILRTISTSSDSAFRHIEAITRSAVGDFDQVSTINTCPGCGMDIHFNFSNKVYRDNEKYEGYNQKTSAKKRR